MLSLMQKIRHNPFDISYDDIEFFFNKNSIDKKPLHDFQQNGNSEHKKNQLICDNCNTSEYIILDNFDGIIVCSKCGSVLDNSILDHSPEWKTFEDSTTIGRCGAPINCLLPVMSLGTVIGGHSNHKLKMLQNWCAIPYRERSLNTVFTYIRNICEKNNLDKCIEEDTKVLYKKASEFKDENHVYKDDKVSLIIRRKNRIGLISACLYYSCKRYNCAKSVKEISTIFCVEPKCVNKGCKNFIKYTKNLGLDYSTSISLPSQYVSRFCKKLNIEQKYIDEIISMTEKIQKLNTITSHTPLSIASACVLHCMNKHSIEHISKNTIAKVFGLSEVTITKAYNSVSKYNKLLYDTEETDIDTSTKIPKNIYKRQKMINNIDINNFTSKFEFTIHEYLSCDMIKHYVKTSKKCSKFITSLYI